MNQNERINKSYELLSDYILRFETEMSPSQVMELRGLVDMLEDAVEASKQGV